MSLLQFEGGWDGDRPDGIPLLSVQSVSVRLQSRLVLDRVSVSILERGNVRICGPNGAGKTTLLNAIMGLVPISTGKIVFRGEDISSLPSHERVWRGIAYMRQRENVFPTLTVRENLQLSLGGSGWTRLCDEFPNWARTLSPNRPAGMLSGGQRQQLAWVMAVLSRHHLLLADEPTAGVAMPDEMVVSGRPSTMWISHSLTRS